MYSSGIFSVMLKLLPRDLVSSRVKAHGSDRWRKRFFTWDHLVSMLAAQMTGAGSLRELEAVFDQRRSQQYHLNISGIKRSTLSEASQSRCAGVFGDIARGLIARQRRGRSRRMHEVLAVLDSSPVRLSGRGFEWAEASVTDMSVSDITEARGLTLEKGRIYVFDKGYCDYNWWHRLISTGAHFVTRLKANAAYKVLESRPVAENHDLIVADHY